MVGKGQEPPAKIYRLPSISIAFQGLVICWVVFLCLTAAGCKRSFYRRTADRDAYCLIAEKGSGPNWDVASNFSIEPDVRSRFYDSTCPTDPTLPTPAPQLYNYQLPSLATPAPPPRDMGGQSKATPQSPASSPAQSSENPNEADNEKTESSENATNPNDADSIEPNARPTPEPIPAKDAISQRAPGVRLQSLPPPPTIPATPAPVMTASAVQASQTPSTVESRSDRSVIVPAQPINPNEADDRDGLEDIDGSTPNASTSSSASTTTEPPSLDVPLGKTPLPALSPIPTEAWESLPETCVRRMLEFESIRVEYQRSYGRPVTEAQLDSAERVSLENLLELALINSREYQTRRETLYRVALRLSIQRFDYDLKFLSRGNGASLRYDHDRVAGTEVNRLRTSTGLGITRSLYTGGDLVARFANDVVLTFNGPSGYSSSIGSELFIDLFQPILQRDVRFEPLTQAERDVVYAARDFVRFQKTLFRDLAGQYFSLLLTYRGIAINTQDYFSNLSQFNRAAASERAGQISLIQVDQFEQNVLRSRGNVINSCNALEGALDRLKVRIGLPTEMPLNLALSELEALTLQDEASVLQKQLARKSRVFQQRLSSEGTAGSVPALTEVARRMLSLAEFNSRINSNNKGDNNTQPPNSQIPELTVLVGLLEVLEQRIEASEKALLLENNAQAAGDDAQLLPGQLLIRNKVVVVLTLEAIRRELLLLQLALAEEQPPFKSLEALVQRWQKEVQAFNKIDLELADIPQAEQAARLPKMNKEAGNLLASSRQLEQVVLGELDRHDIHVPRDHSELDTLVKQVVELSDQSMGEIGLAKLDVDVDQAMLTALVQRLDLMNRRGQLADDWRQIKYAGDDLRSILNLRATQSIRTRSGSDNPLDFTFDDSSTRLSMDFDTPLNRRNERNLFRLTLVNYNQALRNLIEAQDNVKLSIRDDLRDIELDRNQYEIAVASAALAYDRVISTRLSQTLGRSNVTARDFLEAQQDYTRSLNQVAQQHIGYIVDRIQFFLDLEQLQVDSLNFWPELRNESYPFIPNNQFISTTPDGYGCLPDGLWYSDCLRRMEQVPSGVSTIHSPPSAPKQK